MTQTPAYTVIHTRKQTDLPTSGMYLSIRICRGKKGLPSCPADPGPVSFQMRWICLSGQVFLREALPWKNASAESYAENPLIFFILGADFSRMERYNKHGKGIEYRYADCTLELRGFLPCYERSVFLCRL